MADSIADVPTGFLKPSTGGLPTNAWGGTSLSTAKRLVSALPAAPRSRALRDLQFRVMVSELTPPAQDGSPEPTLFRRKVERLAAMGEGESLNEMVRSAGAYVDPGIATMTSNALMMSGEPASACAVVTGHTLIQTFAARARAACQAFAGDSAGALAAAPDLRATEPQLAALLQSAASGQPAAGVPAGPLDGPAMVMFDLARVRPPPAALQSNDPPMIRALVADRSLPIVTRVEAGERGEASAIIEATRLSDLYVLAVRDGAVMPAAMARRARLVAAARNASNADEIMQSLVAVYGEARGSPLFATVARASASSLLTLPAKPEYANVAQEAIRGLLLLGDQRLTQTWTKLALTSVANNARAIIALDRMLPLIAVAGVDNARRLSGGELNRWYDLMQQDDPARAPLRGYLMLELLRATGALPAGATALPETAPAGARAISPPAASLQALQAAAAGRRRAEAALLGSIAIGEIALIDLHPGAVGAIVRAIREAGEDQAGRLFAIEVAIAYGL
ncbi:MAG TPA: hypothetical protein VK630_04860 [Reyranella sp.]|nr:hypothetical protein [Reyranella sp.]